MEYDQHNAIVNFIWGIADDVLRDVYVRGKYRDVILPMVVIRRLDALLEPKKDAVLKMRERLDKAKITQQEPALRKSSGYPFYNTSTFTLRRLRDNPKQLKQNFEDYLDGFSPNVGEIIEKFDFRNQLRKLAESDVLGQLVEKFLDPEINLSPEPVLNGDGTVKLPALSNHGMSAVYEELLRRFSEENNEEAGEHFTPRDVVRLMACLILLPIVRMLTSGTYLLYDDTCGTGGMLTESDFMLRKLAKEMAKEVNIHLYGQEVNPETYAICKSDLLIRGEDEGNIRFGSTLSNDAFPRMQFDLMLANPPYGKSWKTDLDRLCGGDKGEMKDSRFVVSHDGNNEFSLVTRSSDGQLMFLVNMLSKMKADTPLGSRVATVHNGSALFTGDAGQGESNIRQWILENDWLEAIIGLPENLFYNTGIATYIWVLSNRKKGTKREGKVQLIDATEWFTKLRKNLGQKNCKFSDEQIDLTVKTFLDFKETEQSKIFDNADFGYWQITVERPLRLRVEFTATLMKSFRQVCKEADEEPFMKLIEAVFKHAGPAQFDDFNLIWGEVKEAARDRGLKLNAKRERLFRDTFCQRDEAAKPIIAKRDGNEICYEPDPELRDHENVPLKEDIQEYFKREVLPHVPDAWIDAEKTVKGYEISFTKYFYRYQPLRDLKDIAKDLQNLERENEGLLQRILSTSKNGG
jgi:type I restriction enzyme M protein